MMHGTNPRDEAPGEGAGRILLATDLDGTLLGGTEEDRRRLFAALRERSRGYLLVFVTGRGLETVLPILNDAVVPRPEFVIADVGATVVHGSGLEPVHEVLSGMAARWPGTHRVLEALREHLRDRTALIVAHRFSFLSLVDRVLVFAEGRLVEDGAPGALLEKEGLFHALHQAQQA